MTPKEFKKERKNVEEEIKELLKLTESDFTLEDVREVIYNEDGQDSLTDAVMMFDNGDPDNLSNVLETLNDAWNYFPHKILGGLSPYEKLMEGKSNNKKK